LAQLDAWLKGVEKSRAAGRVTEPVNVSIPHLE
jgi:hypothetical protein